MPKAKMSNVKSLMSVVLCLLSIFVIGHFNALYYTIFFPICQLFFIHRISSNFFLCSWTQIFSYSRRTESLFRVSVSGGEYNSAPAWKLMLWLPRCKRSAVACHCKD